MKTFLLSALAVCAITISSCNKCTVCSKANEPDTRYCEKDFDSNTAYGAAIDLKELAGYDCKKSI